MYTYERKVMTIEREGVSYSCPVLSNESDKSQARICTVKENKC